MKPVRGVWICQYSNADWEKVRCVGEIVQVWRYDAKGLIPVDSAPDLDKRNAIASETPVISFCLDESTKRMVYQEWYGLRAGFGSILKLNQREAWVMEKHGWIS